VFVSCGYPGEVMLQCSKCNHSEVKAIKDLAIEELTEAIKMFADEIVSFYKLCTENTDYVDEYTDYLLWSLSDFEEASNCLLQKFKILQRCS
jgi:hypothetical protein